MTVPIDDEGEFTELVDGLFPRVDLVRAAANGVPRFLIAKGQRRGVLEDQVIKQLIRKEDALPSQAVFTATGKLLGAVDPKDIVALVSGDEPDGKAETVSKAATLRNAAEAKIANRAVAAGLAAERALRAGTLTPAGASLARQHANARAGEQIKRLRASRRR